MSNLHLFGHESKNGKNNKSSKDRSGTVTYSNQNGIPVTIVVEIIVTSQGQYSSKAWSKGIKNLGGC